MQNRQRWPAFCGDGLGHQSSGWYGGPGPSGAAFTRFYQRAGSGRRCRQSRRGRPSVQPPWIGWPPAPLGNVQVDDLLAIPNTGAWPHRQFDRFLSHPAPLEQVLRRVNPRRCFNCALAMHPKPFVTSGMCYVCNPLKPAQALANSNYYRKPPKTHCLGRGLARRCRACKPGA